MIAATALEPRPGDTTTIEWVVALARVTGKRAAVWNPQEGCSRAGPGCDNCWAAREVHMRGRQKGAKIAARFGGLTTGTKDGAIAFNGAIREIESDMLLPLRTKAPTVWFVCSRSDLFHQKTHDGFRDRVFAVEALCPHHLFLHLTKRWSGMEAYISVERERGPIASRLAELYVGHLDVARRWPLTKERAVAAAHWPLPNVLLGATVCDQAEAALARPHMERLAQLGWRTWVSYEPALGPIDWTGWDFLRWLVSGGESGPRPSHPDWHRAARDFCAPRGIAYFLKQWGSWAPHTPRAGGDLGGDIRAGRVMTVHPTGESCVEIAERTGGRGSIPGSRYMARVGKKHSGARLDGRAHREVPG